MLKEIHETASVIVSLLHSSATLPLVARAQGHKQKFSFVFSHPFRPFLSLPFLPFSSLSPPRSGPSNPATGFGGRLLAPSLSMENDICSHQTCSLGSMYTRPDHTRSFGVFKARAACLMAANIVLFLLNEI